MRRFLFALFGAMLVATAAASHAGYPPFLSQEQIKNRVLGNTIKTGDWTEYIRPDGTTRVIFQGRAYEGAWRFKGMEGVMCFTYERVCDADGCYRLSLSEDGVLYRGTARHQTQFFIARRFLRETRPNRHWRFCLLPVSPLDGQDRGHEYGRLP
jgi:hypothetical protein